MPHFSSDSKLIGNMFRAQLAEQEQHQRAETEKRLEKLKGQLKDAPDYAQAYVDLANCYRSLGEHLKALDRLREGTQRLPREGDLHYALIRLLQKLGFDEEALAAGKRGCSLVPDDFALRLEYELYLPKLYDTEPEIHAYHRRFAEGLEKCIAACDLSTREGALRVARGFSRYTNFYLAYQGFDDLPLIRRYGEFVHRVMSAAYPQWSKVSGERPVREKSLVGYVSAYFRDHTVGKHFLGWLTDRDRTAYRAHCYYAGGSQDPVTQAYQHASDSFFQSFDIEFVHGGEAVHEGLAL
jgi:protein O-GlcNAc transferase